MSSRQSGAAEAEVSFHNKQLLSQKLDFRLSAFDHRTILFDFIHVHWNKRKLNTTHVLKWSLFVDLHCVNHCMYYSFYHCNRYLHFFLLVSHRFYITCFRWIHHFILFRRKQRNQITEKRACIKSNNWHCPLKMHRHILIQVKEHASTGLFVNQKSFISSTGSTLTSEWRGGDRNWAEMRNRLMGSTLIRSEDAEIYGISWDKVQSCRSLTWGHIDVSLLALCSVSCMKNECWRLVKSRISVFQSIHKHK